MTSDKAFEVWLGRDKQRGPYDVSNSQFLTGQHLCVEDAISNLQWAFAAGFKAANEIVQRPESLLNTGEI
jgi:hypothetical protein